MQRSEARVAEGPVCHRRAESVLFIGALTRHAWTPCRQQDRDFRNKVRELERKYTLKCALALTYCWKSLRFLGSEKKSFAFLPFSASSFAFATTVFDLLKIRMGLDTHRGQRLRVRDPKKIGPLPARGDASF
jgi:hypothetical protein